MKEQTITRYVHIYAPYNTKNNEQECEEFYKDIHDVLNKIDKQDNIIVMASFNARL